MVNSLIDGTLKEIAKTYHVGLLPWLKRRHPDRWAGLLELEDQIDKAALAGDEGTLTKALGEYRELFTGMISQYEGKTIP
jgi:hypothetical protein